MPLYMYPRLAAAILLACFLLRGNLAAATRPNGLAPRAGDPETTATATHTNVDTAASPSESLSPDDGAAGAAGTETTGSDEQRPATETSPADVSAPPSSATSTASSEPTTIVAGAGAGNDTNEEDPAAREEGEQEAAPVQLPLEPRLTPGLGVAGIILLATGAVYGLVGIRIPWLHAFLSTAFLASLGTTALIVHVMIVPVPDAVQGAYVVAVVLTGLLVASAAVFFRDLTECLFALLGGFCLSMWLLCLRPGGLISGTAAKCVFIAALSLAPLALYFNRFTRDYGLIAFVAFSGATAIALGVDCFTRAGLKEFWLYIWNLNPDLFPSETTATILYPITKGIRVETALIVVLCLIGVLSQIGLWRMGKMARGKASAGMRSNREEAENEDVEAGRRVEEGISQERNEWEKKHKVKPGFTSSTSAVSAGGVTITSPSGSRFGRKHSSSIGAAGATGAAIIPSGEAARDETTGTENAPLGRLNAQDHQLPSIDIAPLSLSAPMTEREQSGQSAGDSYSFAAIGEYLDLIGRSSPATSPAPALSTQGRHDGEGTAGDGMDEDIVARRPQTSSTSMALQGGQGRSGRPRGFGMALAVREDNDSTATNADAESSSKSTNFNVIPLVGKGDIEFQAATASSAAPASVAPIPAPAASTDLSMWSSAEPAAATDKPTPDGSNSPSQDNPAMSSRTSLSSLKPENLPAGFSPLASTFRTSEWARHLSRADTPDPDLLSVVADEDEDEDGEKPARLDVAELLTTAESNVSSAREASRPVNFSRKAENSGYFAAPASPSANRTPRTRLPIPGPGLGSQSGPQSLIARREMLLRNRVRAASEARRRAEPLIDQTSKKLQVHWPGLDAESIPMSERRRLIHRRTNSVPMDKNLGERDAPPPEGQ